ncbi:MAG TPA: SPFH domain-containing protein [Planctomycetota bacterium]|nr:SPFH domain-containing protein [Planctomycetota bacterium]
MKAFFAALVRAVQRAWRRFVSLLAAAWLALASTARRVRASIRLARALRATANFVASLLRIGFLGGATAGLCLAALWLGFQRVPPASIGVLQAQWGGGIVEHDFEPGLHFGLRGWQSWVWLDRRTHFAFFGASEQGATSPMLDLRTKEGNEIKVSALVPYRIIPGEGHLLVKDGLRSTYVGLVTATIQDVLMQELALLTAEEFASTETRAARLDATLPRLDVLLARFHVRAETIQIHQVEFRGGYEQILQKKQLTRQSAMLAKASTAWEQELRVHPIEEETARSEMRIRGEMDKEIETIFAEGKLALSRARSETKEFDTRRRAEAQAEYERQIADGERALATASALEDRLKNAAYDSAGGRIELARQGAANLRFREVVLNANDPRAPTVLDVGELTRLLLGTRAP